jgi:hypothetical protein
LNKNIVHNGRNSNKKTIIVIVIAALFIVGAAALSFSINQIQVLAQQQNNSPGNDSLSVHTLLQQGAPLLGKPSAPLTNISPK